VADRPASTAQFTGLNRAIERTHFEKAGYARRVRDTNDRRRILVELTPLAEDAASLYDPLFQGSVELLKERTDRELQVMIDFLERGHEMVELELEKLEREEK
jgi:DNA-binding MarR family transcriptional regulator